MGSTSAELRVDICSNCHPFYTGEQRIVDTEGQVDRFMKRLRVREQHDADRRSKVDAKVKADIPIEDLDLGTRYANILKEAGINQVSDFLTRLAEGGDDSILSIPGIGVKVLTDAKRRISEKGYEIPKETAG